jgi:antirestriction protein ArdC
MKADTYELVTQRIVAKLESGPWSRVSILVREELPEHH